MIKAGDIIKTPGMTLRVIEVRGKYLKCDYWNASRCQWIRRGVNEKRETVEQRVADGIYELGASI